MRWSVKGPVKVGDELVVRIVHKGRYQTGFAGIPCMYAPEFNRHSESIWVEAD